MAVAKKERSTGKTHRDAEYASDLVHTLEAEVETAHPAKRLERLARLVEGPIRFTTSFGLEDQALTHLIFSQDLPIEVVTIDTGRLFPSTYRLWAQTEERFGKSISSVHPDSRALADLVRRIGENGFYASKKARISCCDVRKVEPLGRALEGANAWVTGLRSDQSAERGGVRLALWDEQHRLIKYAPLFDWSRDEVAEFCAAEKVPVNPLHAQGYLSIGCEPCTRAVRPGEDERAGRWWWEKDGHKECGLHLVDGKLVRAGAGS